MTVAIEGTVQNHVPLPVVQFNITCQIVNAGHVVDIGKLPTGIDVTAHSGLEGDDDVVVGHGERERIVVLCIVGERAVLGIAAVGRRDGNALQMVVASDTHQTADHSSCCC